MDSLKRKRGFTNSIKQTAALIKFSICSHLLLLNDHSHTYEHQQSTTLLLFFDLVLPLIIIMSISSTPRGASFDNTPVISPIEFFNAEKLESSIPCLVIKKLSDIVKEYFQLKPQLVKKQGQIKGLYAYNQKMIETIESFMQHQKKIVKKYNKLCHIYVKTFKEYLSNKNMDVNFRDLASPLTSISETFNMNDWKFQLEETNVVTAKRSYEELLLNAIKKNYLNQDNGLQAFLEKQLAKLPVSPEYQAIDHIRSEIRELNTTTPTISNMFDLLHKRKNIENLIKELDENYTCEFSNNDLGFIEELNHIHSIINNPTPDKLKAYLEHQAQIRRNLKKKSKKFREGLQIEFQRVQAEIAELREENAANQKRILDVQAQRNEFRNKSHYWQLKAGVSNSKKDKNASNNTSIIEETQNVGLNFKETNKKLEIRINELESENNQLKQEMAEKEQAQRHIQVKRELMNSNSEMEELRLKLCSKLMEKGIMDTEAMTSGEMFDKLMEKLTVRHDVRSSPRQSKDFIDLKITESIPIIEIKEPNVQNSPNFSESAIEKEPSVLIEHHSPPSQPVQAQEQSNILIESQEKDQNRETQANEANASQPESQPMIQVLTPVKKQVKRSLQQQVQPKMLMKKKNYAAPLTSSALLSISQRKSIDEDSKMHDASKISKEKSLIQERFHVKEQTKQLEELNNVIKELEEKLAKEKQEHEKDIEHYQTLLAERKNKQPSVFQSMDKELKNMDSDHAEQIEYLCQSIVRQLQKLQDGEFLKLVLSVQQALKNFKISQNPALHINEIPVLFNQDHLFKSENIMAHLLGGKQNDQTNRRKNSILIDDKSKSVKLSINSGEVKFQIRFQKSICFGNKDNQPGQDAPRIVQSKAGKGSYIDKDESSIKIDQDELIDIVNDFQGTSRKKKDHNNSEYSLKFSQSNLRSIISKHSDSRDDDIRSSLRIIDKIDRKILNDAEFLSKLQHKIQEIKTCNDSGSDLYWFYKRYRQAMQALQNTQAKLREFQRKKETCMNQLIEQDANLSKHKLQEKIYFLQQRVKELEDRLQVSKEEYQYNMTEHIREIDNIKETAIGKLIQGIFPSNYGRN